MFQIFVLEYKGDLSLKCSRGILSCYQEFVPLGESLRKPLQPSTKPNRIDSTPSLPFHDNHRLPITTLYDDL